jgi:hypothetical protein
MDANVPTVLEAVRRARAETAKAWRKRAVSTALPAAMLAVLVALYQMAVRNFQRLFVAIFRRLQRVLPLPGV